MQLCMCVRSGPPLGVTCICSFGYPGNRRKSQNLSLFLSLCVSPTRGQCVSVCLRPHFTRQASFSVLYKWIGFRADGKLPLMACGGRHSCRSCLLIYIQLSAEADYDFSKLTTSPRLLLNTPAYKPHQHPPSLLPLLFFYCPPSLFQLFSPVLIRKHQYNNRAYT